MATVTTIMVALGCLVCACAQGHPAGRHQGSWSAPPVWFPSSAYSDAPVLGNGEFGAAVGGPAHDMTWSFGSNALWTLNTGADVIRAPGGRRFSMLNAGSLRLQLPGLASSAAAFNATMDLLSATVTHSLLPAGPPSPPPVVPMPSDAALWLRAEDVGLADGAPVAVWRDASGGGHDAAQGVAGKQPTYHRGGLGGLPGVLFDGNASFLAAALALPAAKSIFAVFRDTGSSVISLA